MGVTHGVEWQLLRVTRINEIVQAFRRARTPVININKIVRTFRTAGTLVTRSAGILEGNGREEGRRKGEQVQAVESCERGGAESVKCGAAEEVPHS